jgi:hypothetical protein
LFACVSHSVAGPLTMTALFLGVSIGLMETRQAQRKGYDNIQYAFLYHPLHFGPISLMRKSGAL